MADLPTSDIAFDGIGATAGSADEAARVLALRLNHWRADHPGSRILELQIQSTWSGTNLELTAIIAFLEETNLVEVISTAVAEVVETTEAATQPPP